MRFYPRSRRLHDRRFAEPQGLPDAIICLKANYAAARELNVRMTRELARFAFASSVRKSPPNDPLATSRGANNLRQFYPSGAPERRDLHGLIEGRKNPFRRPVCPV
jgi:hypothetical protein